MDLFKNSSGDVPVYLNLADEGITLWLRANTGAQAANKLRKRLQICSPMKI